MAYPNFSPSATLDATGLQITAWDRILQMRSLPEDIFFTLNYDQSIYNSVTRSIPDAIFLRSGAANADGHSVVIPMVMPLSSDALYGTGVDPITSAEQQSLRQFTGYFNDYVKSAAGYGYGTEFLDGQPYGLMEKLTPQIGTFLKEMFGYWVRYTLINGYSPNLLAAPTSLSVVPHPNTLVKGRPLTQQPAYYMKNTGTTSAATLASFIASQIAGIPSGTSGALTAKMIKQSETYFSYTCGIQPMTIPWAKGEKGYILTIPVSQNDYLLDPSNTDGLGVGWQATSRYANSDMAGWPQVLGKVGMTWLVTDPRAPSVLVSGTGSGSTTGSTVNAVYADFYQKPGLNDARALGTSGEACFFLGKGGLLDLEREPTHYETEKQMLNKVLIKGACGSRGFNRVSFDKSTATATSKINQSSGIIWVRPQTSSFGS
jgi:hypothetical protein